MRTPTPTPTPPTPGGPTTQGPSTPAPHMELVDAGGVDSRLLWLGLALVFVGGVAVASGSLTRRGRREGESD